MSALDDIKKIPLDDISPLEAAVFYLSGKHFIDAENAAEELRDILAELAALRRVAEAAGDVIDGEQMFGYPSPYDMKKLEEALSCVK